MDWPGKVVGWPGSPVGWPEKVVGWHRSLVDWPEKELGRPGSPMGWRGKEVGWPGSPVGWPAKVVRWPGSPVGWSAPAAERFDPASDPPYAFLTERSLFRSTPKSGVLLGAVPSPFRLTPSRSRSVLRRFQAGSAVRLFDRSSGKADGRASTSREDLGNRDRAGGDLRGAGASVWPTGLGG